MVLLGLLVSCISLIGCNSPTGRTLQVRPVATAPVVSTTASPSKTDALLARSSRPRPSAQPPRPPPPTDAGTMIALTVDGCGDAVVAIPERGSAPHPIVVATHGNWDRPSWECDWWRRVFVRAFILCPRGVLRSDSPEGDPRFTYVDDRNLESEAEAGLLALATAYTARVGTGANPLRAVTWVGLSRGAFLGAEIAPRRAAVFPRLVLVEGGHDPWTFSNAKMFADGGGKRVLFICGQGACTTAAQKASRMLTHVGVSTRVEMVAGMGHGLSNDAAPIVRAALPWLMASP